MLNKLVLCSLFLFIITTSLLAEINFKFKEKIDPVIVSNNSWNYSWTLDYDSCAKGMAGIYNYNTNTYITSLHDDNRNIIIKKLNKTKYDLEDFVNIKLDDPIVTTNEDSSQVVMGASVLSGEFLVFFYSTPQGILKMVKVNLNTKDIIQHIVDRDSHFVLDAITDYDKQVVYVLVRNLSDTQKYKVLLLHDVNSLYVREMTLPQKYYSTRISYNTLMLYNGKVSASGCYWYSKNRPCFLRCDINFNTYSTDLYLLYKGGAIYLYDGMCTRSLSYQSNGKLYTYTIRTIKKSNPQNGLFLYSADGEDSQKILECGNSNKYAYVTSLYADETGFYTGEINTQQYNRITIHKRTLDGLEIVGAHKKYYDDHIIREFKQINATGRVVIGDTEYMLTLASGYGYDGARKTALYFIPIVNSPVFYFFKNEEHKNSVLYPLQHKSNEGTYTYKFLYCSFQNVGPSGIPMLHIYDKEGKSIKSDGFAMNPTYYDDNNYTDGVVYTYMTTPSDIPKMNPNDKYTYQIRVGEYISQMYDGPFYFTPGEIKISAYEGSYITPQEISPSSDISVQITVIGTDGIKLASEYPRVMVYRSEDLVNPIEIKGSTYTVLSPIEGSDNGYRASIGRLPTGNYTCKISVRNEYGVEKEVISNFICSLTNEITEYEGSYITPISDINPTKEIFFQMTYRGTDGIKLASEYPRVMVYKSEDLVNPIEIKGSTYTVLSPIEGSDNGYRASIGRLPKGNYKYQLVTRNEYGNEKEVIADFSVASLDTSICYNAPNPFNPNKVKTKIRFNVNNDEIVNIKIYTLDSKLVFEDSYLAKAGTNDYEYRGKDDKGNTLYNGVYLCIIDKQGGKVKCKIAIVK